MKISAGFSHSHSRVQLHRVIAVLVYIAGAVSLYIDLVGKNRIEYAILLKIMEAG